MGSNTLSSVVDAGARQHRSGLRPLDFDLGTSPVRTAVPGVSPVVWLADVERQGDAAERLAPGLFDEVERRRAAGFVYEADRRMYVTAHVALRVLLGAFLGRDPGEVVFAREPCPLCGGPHGRPVVAGGGVHFSLSHSRSASRGVGLLAFAGVPVGVDVEAVPAEDLTVTAVGGTLHPREVAELGALSGVARRNAFARVWARKEAYLKGIGTGVAGGLDSNYVGTAGAGPTGWNLTEVNSPDGFAAAVAVQGTALT